MSAFRDLRYALRMLRRSPGYSAAAVLILALGIGANTAIFSVVRAVLLRPLPFERPDSLAWVWATRVDRDRAFYSTPNFLDTRARARAFAELAAFTLWGPTVSGEGEPERLSAVRMTGNAFGTLGVEAEAGRVLRGEDAEPEAARVAVISHGLWMRRFGGDAAVVGRSVLLNGEAYTVVGVLRPGFLFPGAEDAEVAVPISLTSDARRSERGSNILRVFGRLAPGADSRRAQAELAGITDALRRDHPPENAKLTAPRVLPLTDEIVGGSRRLLAVLAAAVGLLLAVACANLASLTLVRGLARRREIAIRKALGAGSARLIRPFVLETLALSAAGAAAAAALADQGVRWLLATVPASMPRAAGARIDGPVLAFTAAVAAVCALVCAAGPAWLAARSPAAAGLGAGRQTGGAGVGRARRAFVVAQVALSLTLLAAAGLLAKSFARTLAVSPGFASERVLTVRIALSKSRYPDPDAARLFFERAAAQLRAVPGVADAGAISVLPLSGANARNDFWIVGRPADRPEEIPGAQSRWVDAGYFATLGIPVRRGRVFTEHDDARAPGAAVVDENLANAFWPGADPLGARLRIEDAAGRLREISVVGVVGGVKHFSLEEDPLGTLYLPIAQIPPDTLSNVLNSAFLVVRTRVEPLAAAGEVRRAIRAIDPDVPTGAVKTMADVRGAALASRRFAALLIGLFAATAAALAGTGLYGTLAQLVAQERRSIGIRLALGASPGRIRSEILGRGVALTLAGVAAGAALALGLSRLLAASLYRVSPADPGVYLAAGLLLMAVACAACALPARRAARVDPVSALRSE